MAGAGPRCAPSPDLPLVRGVASLGRRRGRLEGVDTVSLIIKNDLIQKPFLSAKSCWAWGAGQTSTVIHQVTPHPCSSSSRSPNPFSSPPAPLEDSSRAFISGVFFYPPPVWICVCSSFLIFILLCIFFFCYYFSFCFVSPLHPAPPSGPSPFPLPTPFPPNPTPYSLPNPAAPIRN